MEMLTFGNQTIAYQWASDVAFDGIRMEVLSEKGDVIFDVSMSDDGLMTVNTFGKEVAADLIKAAVEIAQRRQ